MAKRQSKQIRDDLDIPAFLLVKKDRRVATLEEARAVLAKWPTPTATVGDGGPTWHRRRPRLEQEPQHVRELREEWRRVLGEDIGPAWDSGDARSVAWARDHLIQVEAGREIRRAERDRARTEMVSIAEIAAGLGCRARAVKRALRHDTPEAKKLRRRLPKLARMRRFAATDAADVMVVVRAGIAAADSGAEAIGAKGGRHRERARSDGTVSFRDVVLALREESAEFARLTRAKVAPMVRDRWPDLLEQQRVQLVDVEAMKAAVRAKLGRPAAAPPERPPESPVGKAAPQSASAPEGRPAKGKAAPQLAKAAKGKGKGKVAKGKAAKAAASKRGARR